MTAETLSPIRRPHTVLGVCEAIGEDFGFNPLYLRIAFAAGLFFSPMWVIASYLGLGVIVALSRWVSPVPNATPAMAVEADEEPEPLKLAA
mgnify:CR=1 FL=1